MNGSEVSSLNLSYIPAGVDFLKTLAAHLRDDSEATQTPLAEYQILLPTRRAVRTLQQYLMPADGTAAFLPRMDAIGDLDDDILTLHLPDMEMKPIISNTARLGQLMQMIAARQEMPLPRALALAEALAKLMDEATLREVSLSQLADLVTGDIAEHWNISLNWLQIIMEEWPKKLAARGEVDSAQARQNLLHHYANMWRENPPVHPVIAAGSTGSLPATRRLLRVIAELPRGHVILPALDTNLPDDIWGELPESHPEKNLKNLLDDFGITRSDVKSLCEYACDHAALWQQVLLPAAATDRWRDPKSRVLQAKDTNSKYLKNLHCVTAPHPEAEAQAIAWIMAEAATQNKTAALITPDRKLAQRTAARLLRFNIEVNDTAGYSLDQSPPGRWLRMILECLATDCDAVSVLGILKHPLSCFGLARADCRQAARTIEKNFFRADIPVQNLSALLTHEDVPLRSMLKLLCTEIQPRSIREWTELCQQWGIALTAEPDAPPLLWQGDAGEALQKCLTELAAHSEHFPALPIDGFTELLLDQMQNVTLHPHAMHPNLQILGPLEARLHHYDVVILGGLNEGTWPQAASADPWLSRPMRKGIKLAVPEEMIALTAHDFYQLATQGKVYLTRAAFSEGAPALPSRWWQRLTAYLQACQLNGDILEDRALLARAENMHHADVILPAQQPRPIPTAPLRPRRYSPSAIECLMRNPYEFYAKYILGLYALPDLGGEADEKEQGNLLHKIFAEFTDEYPAAMPQDAAAWLDARAQEKMTAQNLPETLREFWWQNWLQARSNFIVWQTGAIAQGRRVLKSEYELSHELPTPSGPVVLRAIADRIDLDADGNFVIVDYKRKNAPSRNEAVNFKKPQLLIEAWLLAQCGMDGHATRTVAYAEFWPLLQEQIITPDVEKFTESTAQLPEELSNLLLPYLNGDKSFAPRMPSNLFEDQKRYVQLSRANEWQGRAA